jgi:hypothetical protein
MCILFLAVSSADRKCCGPKPVPHSWCLVVLLPLAILPPATDLAKRVTVRQKYALME